MKNDPQTFPVSVGLLDPRHVKAIDPSSPVWVYLWLLNRVTRDECCSGDDFLGIVLRGRPVSIREIADELGMKERACRRHLARLVRTGYVHQKKTGVGSCTYAVTKSKRWAWKRRTATERNRVEPQTSFWPQAPGPTDQKVASGSGPTDQILVKPDQKVVSAEGGTRARSQESQESHKERGRSRDTLSELPTDFAPKDSHRHLAGELNLNLDMVFSKFCDHHASKGTTFKDWDRALNTWLRREHDFAKAAGPRCVATLRPAPRPLYGEACKEMQRQAVGR
jgi:hypothetical protein